ncbi:hypothetical protein, partial [Antrihabitans spumae]
TNDRTGNDGTPRRRHHQPATIGDFLIGSPTRLRVRGIVTATDSWPVVCTVGDGVGPKTVATNTN